MPLQFQGGPSRSKSGPWPNSWNSPPLPPNIQETPPTHQPMKLPACIKTDNPIPWCCSRSEMAYTLWSVSLSKSTSYLLLCLSLYSFCSETSRTQASLSLKTRYDLNYKTIGSSPNLSITVLGGMSKNQESFLIHQTAQLPFSNSCI